MNTGNVLWTPPPDVRERTRIGAYLAWLKETRGLDFADYDALWSWSVTELEAFWRSVWDYFDVHPLSLPPGEGRGEGSPTPTTAVPFGPGETMWFQTLETGEQLHLRNDEDQPLVLLQVTLSADHPATPVAAPHQLPKWPDSAPGTGLDE